MKYSLLFISTLLLAACSGDTTQSPTTDMDYFYAPEAGTVIAADSTPIEGDDLNDFYFSVRITATDSSSKGQYALDAAYGPNDAHTILGYPKLDRLIKPAMRPDDIPYSYIIGFYFEGSDSFKDYARVTAQKTGFGAAPQIEIKYLKSYFMAEVEKK